MTIKKEIELDFETRRISVELGVLIDAMKKPIEEFSWGAVKPSDKEASLALARKIIDAGIMKPDKE